jgi:hypothetical protein
VIPSPEAVGLVIDALNDLRAPYLITGSIASNAYGEARATIDADFVVDTDSAGIQQLRQALSQRFLPEPQLAFETVTGKVQHKFRFAATKFMIEIFEADLNDPHERARFERRRPETLLGRPTFFPTPEDVLVQKLRWFHRVRRSKDQDDVEKVMMHQWPVLDWPYIERWCAEHGSLAEFIRIRAEVRRLVESE